MKIQLQQAADVLQKADEVLTEIEEIVGTTDPEIAAARTSLDLERILGE